MGIYTAEELMALTHLAEENDTYYNAVVPPVFMTSLHKYNTMEQYHNGNYIYGRKSNPLVEMIEKKIAHLENAADALVFSSGMAAFSAALMHSCKAGSHIICQKSVYGPVKNYLDRICIPKLGMEVTYLSCLDLSEIEKAATDKTDLIIIESPSTFVLDIIDIKGVCAVAKKCGAKTYIDNTWCTSLYQKPLDFGVDYVMHTASKYFGGHSDIIGGVLAIKDKQAANELKENGRELLGSIIGPMEAWLMLRGMRTLHIRLKEHQSVATMIAEYLEGHEKVKKVYYPGLKSHNGYELGKAQMQGTTGLLAFELKDESIESSIKFVDALKIFGKGCSWGGFESLALVPLCNTTERELEFYHCSRGLIRVYCGLEGFEVLKSDLYQAFNYI